MEQILTTEDKSAIAREILAYLSDHPASEDTLEGVAQWWLMERKIRYHISLIKQALSYLVERGLVLEISRNKLNPNYKLNQNRKDDITGLLECGSNEVLRRRTVF
jgi:hypothetical protein